MGFAMVQCLVSHLSVHKVTSSIPWGTLITHPPLQSIFSKTHLARRWLTAEISKVPPKVYVIHKKYEKTNANNLPLQHFIAEDVQENLKNYKILQAISNANIAIFIRDSSDVNTNDPFPKFTVVYLNVETVQQRLEHLYSSQ